VTAVRVGPPSSLHTGWPSTRPRRSHSARSTAPTA